jgi:putative tryptophan/tyrosine transport system substrate-binding protein
MSEATMTRRTIGLLVTLALALLGMPLMADAQQPTKVYRIGRLSAGSPPEVSPPGQRTAEAFRQGLHELGYVEGQNLVIEWRFAEGRLERLPELAAELVRLPVDVLVVAGGEPVIRAAQQATHTIPIVFAGQSDPVGAGSIASLAQPGGNLTGLNTFSIELYGKRLELLKELVPQVARIAALANPAFPGTARAMLEVQRAAQALGVQLHIVEVRSPDAFEHAFAAITSAGIDALLVLTDPLTFERHVSAIIALARQTRLPAMYPWRAYVEAGGLMVYGASLPDIHRRAAYYVDRILKGTKPADLPVEQPTTFELVINLKTAKELGLTIPPPLLFQATEVIR